LTSVSIHVLPHPASASSVVNVVTLFDCCSLFYKFDFICHWLAVAHATAAAANLPHTSTLHHFDCDLLFLPSPQLIAFFLSPTTGTSRLLTLYVLQSTW